MEILNARAIPRPVDLEITIRLTDAELRSLKNELGSQGSNFIPTAIRHLATRVVEAEYKGPQQ